MECTVTSKEFDVSFVFFTVHDFDDDDELIKYFIVTGENLCADIARISVEELSEIPSSKIAVMYAVAYLYEHREDADHHALTISLRSLLFGSRREVF